MAKIKVTGGVKVSGQLRAKRFNTPPAWDTIAGSLGTPFENQAFTVTPGATDPDTFPDANITYSLVSGSLPSGLTLNTTTSEISGTPAAVGSDTLSNFTLRASDGEIGANKPGKFDERDFSINVLNDVAPSFDQAADFSIGSVAELAAATLFQITATDPNTNPQTITFSEVGAVLTGDNLSLDSNGNVTGTPPDSGGTRVVTFTVRASDGTLTTDQDYKLTITDSQDPIWVTAVGLLATVNESEAITTITLVATDDNAVSYSVTSGALPSGLTLNSSNGEITGTPSNVAEDTTSDFEVTATDTVELDFTARCFSIKVLNIIVNSLRFNDDDGAYLSRTPSASDTKKWTFNFWMKRGSNFGGFHRILDAGADASNRTSIIILVDKLSLQNVVTSEQWVNTSTALFRDPSAWYNFLVVFDSDNGTAGDRIKLYANGIRLTTTGTNPGLGDTSDINSADLHQIGRHIGSSNFIDGYLAETVFVDGQALTPTDFGAFDANGDWQPKEYSGAFGTNGFHLDFAVAPGTGNGGGTDVSGNTNHFTDNGLAANDQVTDSPTNNYCVLNSIHPDHNAGDIANGNLDIFVAASSSRTARGHGTIGIPDTDKWVWQFISNSTDNLSGIVLPTGGGGTRIAFNLAAVANGSVVRVEADADAGTLKHYDDGSLVDTQSSIDYSLGYVSTIVNDSSNNSVSAEFDFGQLGFTIPGGFNALCTANLPTPTIADPSDHYDTIVYTGNGTSLNTNTIKALDFAPNFVWIKQRSNVNGHSLNDTIRGTTTSLSSNSNANENNFNTITAFNSDGYTAGTSAQTNANSASYVAWCWNESTTPGFDIVSYTGTGSAHTESHSLGVVPDLMIVKGRDLASNKGWRVYHSSNTAAPETDFLNLNETSATADSAGNWNDTAPTASVFTVGTDSAVNADTKNYIAYLWTGVEGFSRFGSYTGNSSTDGPFVWCGFRPAYVMIKRTDVADNWIIHDTERDTDNAVELILNANITDIEAGSGTASLDMLSNGFKLRVVSTARNASGGTYIFVAFAESPFKTARAR